MQVLWLRFLSEISEKTTTIDSDLLEVPEIQEAVSLAQESAYTREELEAYESYWCY